MATNEQLIQYLFLLTKNQLMQHFGVDQGELISKSFDKQFNKLYANNENLMPDKLAKWHGINPIFVIALDDVLKEHNVFFQDLKALVLAIYEAMLLGFLKQQTKRLEASENPWKAIVELMRAGNKQYYENEYFQLKAIEDDENEFSFDIQRCLYFEIFRENGRPELGPILCEYDYIQAKNLENWVEFEREETIAKGNHRCTFRNYRKSVTPD